MNKNVWKRVNKELNSKRSILFHWTIFLPASTILFKEEKVIKTNTSFLVWTFIFILDYIPVSVWIIAMSNWRKNTVDVSGVNSAIQTWCRLFTVLLCRLVGGQHLTIPSTSTASLRSIRMLCVVFVCEQLNAQAVIQSPCIWMSLWAALHWMREMLSAFTCLSPQEKRSSRPTDFIMVLSVCWCCCWCCFFSSSF